MTAFREALSKEFGVFGEHAFDTILGLRMQTHKSLRACDIKNVLSNIEFLKANRYISEYSDGHPKLMLEAKFAEDYKDMGKGYLKDGRIVPPNGQKLESLGKVQSHLSCAGRPRRRRQQRSEQGLCQGKFLCHRSGAFA